jgi:hypothetical protein
MLKLFPYIPDLLEEMNNFVKFLIKKYYIFNIHKNTLQIKQPFLYYLISL